MAVDESDYFDVVAEGAPGVAEEALEAWLLSHGLARDEVDPRHLRLRKTAGGGRHEYSIHIDALRDR